jgi:hypothetical protein
MDTELGVKSPFDSFLKMSKVKRRFDPQFFSGCKQVAGEKTK